MDPRTTRSAVSGTGVLRSIRGEVLLAHAEYRLNIRADGSAGATQPLDGMILNPPFPWGFPVTALGTDLILDLADGRQWHCALADHEGRLLGRPERITSPLPRVSTPAPLPRILLVDDEPSNLEIVQRFLQDTRYIVTAVGSASDALQACEERGAFDLYVLDVMMPEMRGTELADIVRSRHPTALVLYFTGYADTLFSGKRLLSEHEAFIQKPVTKRELLEAVSLLLFKDLKGPRG